MDQSKSEKRIRSSKSTSVKSNTNNNENVLIMDDKTINEILGNLGKKTKNSDKKQLINNFLEKKNTENDNKKNSYNKKNDDKKTYTDNLTKDDINEKLEDYKLVDDISKVPLDTHLRYFVKKGDTMLFRMGGNLKRNLDLPNYIVLKNALGTEWSVQVKDTVFYKKMTIKEIKQEYDTIIEELHDKIKKLKQKIKELEK